MMLGSIALGLFAAAAALAPARASTAPKARSLGPGCDPVRLAVAHHTGGAVLSPQPLGGPVACSVGTGFPGAESHLLVTEQGTVVYTPAVLPSGTLGTGEGPAVDPHQQGNANPAGLAVSSDGGAHWSLVRPYGLTWNPTDHADFLDRRTGRIFFEDYGPIPLAPSLGALQEGPAHIMSTDDRVSWHHAAIAGLVLPENPRFTAAIAPAGQPRPLHYADVTYFCANTNVGFTTPAIQARLCYKSLDGGLSWLQTTVLLSALLPVHAQCGASGEQFSAIDGYYPEPTSDGALYTLVACGGTTFLARSQDEASTFPIVRNLSGLGLPTDSIVAMGSGPQLRVDPTDHFYLMYPRLVGGNVTRLMLRTSSDRGATWSKPVDLTAPGVADISRWAVAVRGTGQLVLSYLGQRAGQQTWDAYLTETTDALAGSPLLWSAPTNRQPVMYGNEMAGAGYIVGQGQINVPYPFPLGIQPLAGAVSAGNDFIGAAVGPDGSAWGSFDSDCGPSPDAPGCQATGDQTRGLVGRLAWPLQPAPHLR
jgi:hypothetical protein